MKAFLSLLAISAFSCATLSETYASKVVEETEFLKDNIRKLETQDLSVLFESLREVSVIEERWVDTAKALLQRMRNAYNFLDGLDHFFRQRCSSNRVPRQDDLSLAAAHEAFLSILWETVSDSEHSEKAIFSDERFREYFAEQYHNDEPINAEIKNHAKNLNQVPHALLTPIIRKLRHTWYLTTGDEERDFALYKILSNYTNFMTKLFLHPYENPRAALTQRLATINANVNRGLDAIRAGPEMRRALKTLYHTNKTELYKVQREILKIKEEANTLMASNIIFNDIKGLARIIHAQLSEMFAKEVTETVNLMDEIKRKIEQIETDNLDELKKVLIVLTTVSVGGLSLILFGKRKYN
jgi:hypothetical protein